MSPLYLFSILDLKFFVQSEENKSSNISDIHEGHVRRPAKGSEGKAAARVPEGLKHLVRDKGRQVLQSPDGLATRQTDCPPDRRTGYQMEGQATRQPSYR